MDDDVFEMDLEDDGEDGVMTEECTSKVLRIIETQKDGYSATHAFDTTQSVRNYQQIPYIAQRKTKDRPPSI